MFFWFRRERKLRQMERWIKYGQYASAEEELMQLMQKCPKDSMLNMHWIWLMYEKGDLDKALDTVLAQLKERPKDAILLLLQGEIYLKKKQFALAKEALEQSLFHSPDNIRAEYALAKSHLALGNFVKATELFESSVKYDKTFLQSRLLTMAEHYLQNLPNITHHD